MVIPPYWQAAGEGLNTDGVKSSLPKGVWMELIAACVIFSCSMQAHGIKKWQYQATLPASWETCMQDKKQQLELDIEYGTGSKLGKEYIKAVYCHLFI